ncbi:MAG TPA: class I SAM-dependent methyltransferase [Acidobacteriota bacterium]|nr:class I SAM-dependent methyltransferase [Acidobacteriota bacterium]
MNRNTAKKFLSQNYLLLKTAKSIRFYTRKIFIGYKRYPDIPGRIHFNDQSLIKNNSDHYKSVGESAVKLIESSLQKSGKILKENANILDFPCGYGRVLRFLKKAFPQANFYGGDVDPRALTFCKKEFNIIPVQSYVNFRKVKFPVSYDLIWVGSLFTHIDSQDFQNLLKTLISSLQEKGIIIFTTHGKECLDQLSSYGLDDIHHDLIKRQLENTGFVFQSYPGQSSYGISICTRLFVMKTVNQAFGDKVRPVFYKKRGWDDHQDVYAFQKTSRLEG